MTERRGQVIYDDWEYLDWWGYEWIEEMYVGIVHVFNIIVIVHVFDVIVVAIVIFIIFVVMVVNGRWCGVDAGRESVTW